MKELDVSERSDAAGRVRVVGGVSALVLLCVGGLWWSRSGAHLAPVGNTLSYGDVPVGQEVFVGYPLYVRGGAIEIDDVQLERGSASVEAEFLVPGGECPVGLALVLPVSCRPGSPSGATVREGSATILVGRYVLTAETPTTADGAIGDVVVSYHDGLRRRSVNLGMRVCLSTTPRC